MFIKDFVSLLPIYVCLTTTDLFQIIFLERLKIRHSYLSLWDD